MTTLQSGLRGYAGHPAVRAAVGVWDHLAAAAMLNGLLAMAAAFPALLFGSGAVIPAIALGALVIGPAWGIVGDAASQMVAGRAHLSVDTMARSARNGLLVSSPLAFTLLALHAAMQMASVGPGSGVRTAAIAVDLLAIGTLVVLIPALSVECWSATARWPAIWRSAADRTGHAPLRTVECLGLTTVLIVLGLTFPLIAILIGPVLLAVYASASFAVSDDPDAQVAENQ